MRQLLAGSEHIKPARHAVLVRGDYLVADFRDGLVGDTAGFFPDRHTGVQQAPDVFLVVVLRAHRAELAGFFAFGRLDVLPLSLDQLLPLAFDDYAVGLAPQPAGLRFAGDVAGFYVPVALGGNAAAGVGTFGLPRPGDNGSWALGFLGVHDFKVADAARFIGEQADALALAVQSPVGGQGNQVAAAGALDRPAEQIRPNVFVQPDGRLIREIFGIGVCGVVRRFRGIDLIVGDEGADAFQQPAVDGFVLGHKFASELLGPLAGGAQDEGCHRVELVGDSRDARAARLKGDAAATGGNIQHDGVGRGQVVLEPLPLRVGEVVAEGARVVLFSGGPLGIDVHRLLESVACGFGGIDFRLVGDDFRVGAHQAQNVARSASDDSRAPATAARLTSSGRRAHQTCIW